MRRRIAKERRLEGKLLVERLLAEKVRDKEVCVAVLKRVASRRREYTNEIKSICLNDLRCTGQKKRKRVNRDPGAIAQVLTDAELEILLDRSPEAYSRAKHNAERTEAFATVETVRDADNDALATRL